MDKYTDKKRKNQLLKSLIQEHVSEKTLERIEECNSFLLMITDEKMTKEKLHKSNNCENRFCPICAYKKARKNALQLSVMIDYIKNEYNKDFLFLTLTAPNVGALDLDSEIKKYNQSFKKLMERKEVKKVVKGYVRKLEVTYNKKRDDYHPHFHVILAVNKNYFKKSSEYIKQERWLELWRQSTKNPLITQVDIRKIKFKDNKKEVSEIAKYSAKDSDYLQDKKVFDVFYKSLSGKRLIVYSGLFKEASKKYKNKELEDYKEKDMTVYIYQILYNWNQNKYLKIEQSILENELFEEVNKNLIDDMEIDE